MAYEHSTVNAPRVLRVGDAEAKVEVERLEVAAAEEVPLYHPAQRATVQTQLFLAGPHITESGEKCLS